MKKILFLVIVVLLCGSLSAQQEAQRKKVGVVLSGGGAKGMAHIGVLKVLEKAGIPVDVITGTSMGSIVGGLYAIGYNANALDSVARAQDWNFIISDRENLRDQSLGDRRKQNTYVFSTGMRTSKRDRSAGGLIKGKNLAVLFDKLCVGYTDSLDFSRDLPIPFACVATDIIKYEEYDFHSGRLPQAMRASMAIPAVFSPVRIDSCVLVDGGMRNNFPVDIARQMGADIVIGISVHDHPKTVDDVWSTMSVLNQIVDANTKNKFEENKAATDVYMYVDPEGYGAASFSAAAIDTLIRRGEEEAMRHWDELMALKQRIGIDDSFRPTILHPHEQQDTVVQQRFQPSKPYSKLRLYGGVRFDTEENAALQVGLDIPLRIGVPVNTDLTVRLGKRLMARAELTILPRSFNCHTISYTFRRNDMDIYYQGDRDYNILYSQSQAEVLPFNFNFRHFNLQLGIRWDYLHYSSKLVTEWSREVSLKNEHYFSYRARINYNSEDEWNFPTRGARFKAEYAYLTNDFAKLDLRDADGNKQGKTTGMSDVSADWRMSFTFGDRFTLQPMLYGRLLFGSIVPPVFGNTTGGEWFGHYIEQQMPFAGIGNLEAIDAQFVAVQLQSQLRIGDKSYVLVRVAGAQQAEKARQLLDRHTLLGVQGAFYYNSMFGPFGASVGYSNRTKKPYFFVNLGYEF